MHARSQEAGLKVKEYELLRKNFSDTGNFGARLSRVIVQHTACSCKQTSPCVMRMR
jgi:hypothetical protein